MSNSIGDKKFGLPYHGGSESFEEKLERQARNKRKKRRKNNTRHGAP